MEKNIKDYLHLYLGCRAICSTKDHPGRKHAGKMVDVSTSGSNHSPWVHVAFESVETVYRDDFRGGNCSSNMEHFFIGSDEIKPVLRPISSLTRDEVRVLAKLAIGDEDWIDTSYTSGGNDYNIHESIHCLKIEKFCEHPAINNWLPAYLFQIDPEDCSVILGVFSDQGQQLTDTLHDNQHLITKQLLDWGIDVFDLIPAGLAIDSTTLKPQHNG